MKQKTAGLCILLVLTMLLMAIVPVFAAEDAVIGRYVIDIPADKKLIVREKASSDSAQIDYIYNDEIVEVVEVDGSWIKICQNGEFGWCLAKYATLQKEYDCAVLIADISTAECSSVDFAKLAGQGVGGVLLRFGVSVNEASVLAVDAGFAANYIKAKAAGLKVGAYFASTAVNSAQLVKEYEWVLNQLAQSGLSLSLPVFYRPTSAAQKNLSASENTLLVSAFCEQIEKAGYAAGFYLPADWTSANLHFDELDSYAHWIADYGDYCNFTKTYDIWQYRSASDFDAVTGKIGLSYMFVDCTTASAAKPTETTVLSEPTVSETESPTEITTVPEEEKTTAPIAEPAEVHREGSFVVTKEPGCSVCGMECAYCLDCGKLLHTRLIAPVGHRDGQWEIEQEPTADAHGMAVKHCTVCGEVVKMQDLLPIGSRHIHTFADWEYVDAVSQGVLNRIPAEEGTTSESDVGQQAHSYACTTDTEKVLKCTDCGLVILRYAGLPQNHIADENKKITAGDCTADGHDRTVCKICGMVIEDVITPAAGHSVANWTVVKAPTADAPGLRQGTCSVCGETVSEELFGIPGDVNGDGKVNSSDARIVLRVSARLEELAEPVALACADVNGDGKVNSADARSILRKAAKLDIA